MQKIFDFKIHSLADSINEAMDDERKKRLISDLKIYCDEVGSEFSEVCSLLNIDASGMASMDSESVKFLNKLFGEGKWSVNTKTGRIDGSAKYGGIGGYSFRDLEELPPGIELGVIEGKADFSNGDWKSFRGFPTEVTGDLTLRGSKFKSLEGCTPIVGGSFDCSNQKGEMSLTSLKGGPTKVGEGYNCSDNSIDSLEGAPEEIGVSFNCSDNNLRTLEGGPNSVGGSFNCSDNELETLKGFPKNFTGYRVQANSNDLYSLEGIGLKNSVSTELKRNLFPASVLTNVLNKAREYESWTAAYLWLLTDSRFQRMSKAQRDPIRNLLTPENLKGKSITLGKIWKSDLIENPAVKRALKKANISQEFKDDAELGADLSDIGF